MVRIIIEMVGNRSFTLTTRNGNRSMLRRLKSGVPQESVLAPGRDLTDARPEANPLVRPPSHCCEVKNGNR